MIDRATGHPPEESLILHAYGEGTLQERSAIAAHAFTCPECRAVLEEVEDLRPEAQAAAVPDPGPDFEDRIWRRVHAELPTQFEVPRSRVPRFKFSVLSSQFSVPMGLAAALATVSVIGYVWLAQPAVVPDPVVPSVAETRDDSRHRVLMAALDNHLDRTEMLLVEVLNGPNTTSTFGFERAVADDLINSGRLYRATAEELGQAPMRLILDEMQPVLIEIARAPDALAEVDRAAIRQRIDDNNLLFKVRVAAQDVRDRQFVPGVASGGSL